VTTTPAVCTEPDHASIANVNNLQNGSGSSMIKQKSFKSIRYSCCRKLIISRKSGMTFWKP